MRHVPVFELEEYFAEYQQGCSINIGSSGCREFTLEGVLGMCGEDVLDLRNIPLTDSDPSGNYRLRSAVASQYLGAEVDEILMTHGSSEALYLVMASLLRPGDQVITLTPCYQSLIDLPRLFDAEVVPIRLTFDDDYNFPTKKILARMESRTRMVVVNSPHNPTGTMITRNDFRTLAKKSAETGVWLLCDEAFADIVHRGFHERCRRSLSDYCISVGTLSKSFGLTGLRVGWCYARRSLINRMRAYKHFTTINLCPVTEYIASAALGHRDRILSCQRDLAQQGLCELTRWIKGKLDWVPPRGGVCCYPRLPRGVDSDVFCRALAKDYGVFLVPGSVFGNGEHVRLGFGFGAQHVLAGVKAIEELLAAWIPN